MESRRDIGTILLNFLAAAMSMLFCLVCVCVLAYTSWTWWKTRSWQPVQAQLVITQRAVQSRQHGHEYIPAVSYDYSVDGAKYTGSDISLGSRFTGWGDDRVIQELQTGQAVTVWMNPRQPAQSVLLRTFRWYAALCGFFGSLLTFSYILKYFRPDQKLSREPMIRAEPVCRGEYLFFVVYWNLVALQFAVIAVWDGTFWPLLTVFLMVLVGILVAGSIVRKHSRRWQLGPPLLVDAGDDPSMFTARFIFSPRYGVRMPPGQVGWDASLEFRQVIYRMGRYDEALKTVQVVPMGTARLELGSRSIDFMAQLPDDWPIGPDIRPAYWELALKVGRACLIYRYARDLRDWPAATLLPLTSSPP